MRQDIVSLDFDIVISVVYPPALPAACSVFSFRSILGASSSFAGYEPQVMEALKLGASQGKVDNQQADLDTVVAIDVAGEVGWDETGTEDVEVDEEEDSTSLDVADDAEVSHRAVFEGKKTDEEDNPSMVAADGKTEADPGRTRRRRWRRTAAVAARRRRAAHGGGSGSRASGTPTRRRTRHVMAAARVATTTTRAKTTFRGSAAATRRTDDDDNEDKDDDDEDHEDYDEEHDDDDAYEFINSMHIQQKKIAKTEKTVS